MLRMCASPPAVSSGENLSSSLCPYEIKYAWRLPMPRCRKPHMTFTLQMSKGVADAGELTRRHWKKHDLFRCFSNSGTLSSCANKHPLIHNSYWWLLSGMCVTSENREPSIRGLTTIWILAGWSLLLFLFAPLNRGCIWAWRSISEDWRTKTMAD